MALFQLRIRDLADEHDCAACGESTEVPEVLALTGEPSSLTRHLVLCPDCRDDEPELGGQG